MCQMWHLICNFLTIYGNCNIFYRDWNICLHWKSFTLGKSLRYVNFDLESKDEHSPKQAILEEVLVTLIYFMIASICDNAYNYDYANEANNLKANAKSRFTTEEHLRDILQKGSLNNKYLEICCSHFLCSNYFLPSSDYVNGPNFRARQVREMQSKTS
jgi:hypothetical protein